MELVIRSIPADISDRPNGTAQRLQVTFATPPALINSPLQRRVSLRSLAIARWSTICHNTDIVFYDDYNISTSTSLANGCCLRSLANHVSRFFIGAIALG
jgi:hypothetical protein